VAARGGVYKVTSDGTIDDPGVRVFWNDSTKKVTTTALGNHSFGNSVPSQGASIDDELINVEHEPLGLLGS
jgi:hypothetical protein